MINWFGCNNKRLFRVKDGDGVGSINLDQTAPPLHKREICDLEGLELYNPDLFENSSVVVRFYNNGRICHLLPNANCSMTLRQIINKEIPNGSRWKLVTHDEYLKYKKEMG